MRLRIVTLTAVLIAAFAGYVLACDNQWHTVTGPTFTGNGIHITCDGVQCPEHGTEVRVYNCVSHAGWNCANDSFAWTTRTVSYRCKNNECTVRYENTVWDGRTSWECP